MFVEKVQQQTAEAEKRYLEELDEDDYKALTDTEKAEFDAKQIAAKIKRINTRRKQKLAKEKRVLEMKALEERRQEEEKQNKRKRKMTVFEQTAGLTGKGSALSRRGTVVQEKSPGGSSKDNVTASKRRQSAFIENLGSARDSDKADSEDSGLFSEMPVFKIDKKLSAKFQTYEVTYQDVKQVVEGWDRLLGVNVVSLITHNSSEVGIDVPPSTGSAKKGKRDTTSREKSAAEKDTEKTFKEAVLTAFKSSTDVHHSAPEYSESLADYPRVPFIVFDADDHRLCASLTELCDDVLPSVDELLDELGIGPSGPPIPPPAFYTVTPFPTERELPINVQENFVFVASSPDDPNTTKHKGAEDRNEDVTSQTSVSKSRNDKPSRGGSGGKGKNVASSKDKVKAAVEIGKEKRSKVGGGRSKLGRRSSAAGTSPTCVFSASTDAEGQTLGADPATEENGIKKLGHSRWVVPANGEVTIRVHFSSSSVGQFDQTFSFELLGTRRRYHIYCRGVCCFPSISKDPK